MPALRRADEIQRHALAGWAQLMEAAKTAGGKASRRISAVVALTLLEVIRQQDLPTEVLESEDTSHTMPRRLGLSDVIDRQIRRYREEVKRRQRITDEEFRDLVRLVIRRHDSEEVFFHAGSLLAGEDFPGWRQGLPRSLGLGLARRRVRRRLLKLFGRRVGGFAAGPFTLEARTHLFIDGDPGGDACQFVTGFSQSVLARYCGRKVQVVHSLCEARKDPLCRWTVLAEERVGEEAPALVPVPGPVPEPS